MTRRTLAFIGGLEPLIKHAGHPDQSVHGNKGSRSGPLARRRMDSDVRRSMLRGGDRRLARANDRVSRADEAFVRAVEDGSRSGMARTGKEFNAAMDSYRSNRKRVKRQNPGLFTRRGRVAKTVDPYAAWLAEHGLRDLTG